jgi:hypothetical protein
MSTLTSWHSSTPSPTRYRRSSLAALTGGLINLVIAFTGPTANANAGTAVFWVGMFAQALATGLMLAGLYGLHRRYREQYGRVGLALAGLFGIALAWLTMAMAVTGTATLLGVGDTVHAIEGSWFFVNLLGMLVASSYGIALWRTDIRRGPAITMTATTPLGVAIIVVLGATVGDIGLAFWLPLGLAWVAVGYGMVRDSASRSNPA